MNLSLKNLKFLLINVTLLCTFQGCMMICVSGCKDGKIFTKVEDYNIIDNIKHVCSESSICNGRESDNSSIPGAQLS